MPRGTQDDARKLTKRQADIFEFIRARIASGHTPPTLREIGAHFGIKSPNGTRSHLRALQRKGLIQIETKRARGISLTGAAAERAPQLPLAGRVSAGLPTLAIEDRATIDFSDLFAGGNVCLQVDDDAMRDRELQTGDYLVMRRGALQGMIRLIDQKGSRP